MVTEDIVTIGTIAFFVLSLSNLFEPVQQLSQLFNQVQSAGAGLNKLFELLDTPVDIAERPDGGEDLPSTGEIRVENVRSRYATAASRCLRERRPGGQPGERLALVGPDRRRQVDAGQARSPGSTTRPTAGHLRRRRPAGA